MTLPSTSAASACWVSGCLLVLTSCVPLALVCCTVDSTSCTAKPAMQMQASLFACIGRPAVPQLLRCPPLTMRAVLLCRSSKPQPRPIRQHQRHDHPGCPGQQQHRWHQHSGEQWGAGVADNCQARCAVPSSRVQYLENSRFCQIMSSLRRLVMPQAGQHASRLAAPASVSLTFRLVCELQTNDAAINIGRKRLLGEWLPARAN